MGVIRIASLIPITKEKESFIEENLKLIWYDVHFLIKRMKQMPKNLNRDDMYAEGYFGLQYAVQIRETKPDDVRWTTFAHWHIRRAIRRAIENYNRSIRLPSNIHDDIGILRRTKDHLLGEGLGEPTPQELATYLDWPLSFVRLLEVLITSELKSIEQSPKNADGNTPADLGQSLYDNHEDITDPVVNETLSEVMKSPMLSVREREILLRKVVGEESHEGIGDEMNVTRQRIQQIHARALAKVREDSRMRRHDDENIFVPNMRTAQLYRFANHERSDEEWWKANIVKLEWTEERRRQWAYGSIPRCVGL